ncbi:MAG: hypothetical protein V2I40_04230 [Desulfobacteraceae bacterium]|jgi:FixJ family two-component response regulator|nr:hypothetical protein [Desulfobacteraceae bacterium]
MFMSGYTSDVITQHGVVDATVNFIEKPFSRQALITKVQSTLAG